MRAMPIHKRRHWLLLQVVEPPSHERKTATSNAAFANYLFPAITESHFTIGLSYKMDKNLSISGYYLHAPEISETAATSSLGGTTAPGTTISMTQNAFGLGVSYAAK